MKLMLKPLLTSEFKKFQKTHLAKYTTPDVTEELQQDKPIVIDGFDDMVADLVGGSMPITSYVSRSSDDIIAPIGVPPEIARLMNELHENLRGTRGGVAIIGKLDFESLQFHYVGIGNITILNLICGK